MSTKTTTTMYCPQCGKNVLTCREDINLFLAFILVIFTSGIGLLIYLIIYYEREPTHCVHCKTVCEPLYLENSTENSGSVTPVHTKDSSTHYCFNCGVPIEREETKYCPLCGTLI